MRYVKTEVHYFLPQVRVGQKVTVCYFGKSRKEYLTLTGRISQINNHRQHLTFGETNIPFAAIDIIAIP